MLLEWKKFCHGQEPCINFRCKHKVHQKTTTQKKEWKVTNSFKLIMIILHLTWSSPGHQAIFYEDFALQCTVMIIALSITSSHHVSLFYPRAVSQQAKLLMTFQLVTQPVIMIMVIFMTWETTHYTFHTTHTVDIWRLFLVPSQKRNYLLVVYLCT